MMTAAVFSLVEFITKPKCKNLSKLCLIPLYKQCEQPADRPNAGTFSRLSHFHHGIYWLNLCAQFGLEFLAYFLNSLCCVR